MCIKKADPEVEALRARRAMSDREDAHLYATTTFTPETLEPPPPVPPVSVGTGRIQVPDRLRRQWARGWDLAQ